jgi:hypothetical protein
MLFSFQRPESPSACPGTAVERDQKRPLARGLQSNALRGLLYLTLRLSFLISINNRPVGNRSF